jgi:hypothetical protein
MGRDVDLLIAYALRFGCHTWQRLMSSALSAMKHRGGCNGHSASGVQRYICKHCSKTFELNFSYSVKGAVNLLYYIYFCRVVLSVFCAKRIASQQVK